MKTGERIAFYEALLETFGPDAGRLAKAIAAYTANPTEAAVSELHGASEPRRQELFRASTWRRGRPPISSTCASI